MATRAINIHQANEGFLRGLEERGELVLVTRETKWGNPFSHLKVSKARYIVASREEAIAKHAEWLLQQPELMRALVPELRGKVLGCVCLPQLCHASTLARYADEYPMIKTVDDGLSIAYVTFDEAGYCTGSGFGVKLPVRPTR